MLLGRQGAEETVASFLLDLRGHDATKVLMSLTLEAPMGRPDIVDHLGLTSETMSRTLTRLDHRETVRADRARQRLPARPGPA